MDSKNSSLMVTLTYDEIYGVVYWVLVRFVFPCLNSVTGPVISGYAPADVFRKTIVCTPKIVSGLAMDMILALVDFRANYARDSSSFRNVKSSQRSAGYRSSFRQPEHIPSDTGHVTF